MRFGSLAAALVVLLACVTAGVARADQRTAASAVADLQVLMARMDKLESENRDLRQRLEQRLRSKGPKDDDDDDDDDDKKKKKKPSTDDDERASPSFRHQLSDSDRDSGNAANMFVEMEEGGQAKASAATAAAAAAAAEKEDPTIECQTVCKFVRPNAASSLNAGRDAQSAALQAAEEE
jgi:hypothetical protein